MTKNLDAYLTDDPAGSVAALERLEHCHVLVLFVRAARTAFATVGDED